LILKEENKNKLSDCLKLATKPERHHYDAATVFPFRPTTVQPFSLGGVAAAMQPGGKNFHHDPAKNMRGRRGQAEHKGGDCFVGTPQIRRGR
jgi:hypothetical protein